jgi:4-amino-4-deoxy-L-arabinose transferase-like glycosyltransferase
VTTRSLLWWMVVIMLVATALRLPGIGQIPPGLYHDESQHGLDALTILDGTFPLYFPANNGREPLFIYLVTLTVGLLGRSPLALRLASVPVGLITIATTCAMGRSLFSRRVGAFAAATLAVTLWHVHLSRVGFRAVLLPMFVSLTTWQVALAIKTRRRRHWLAAGVAFGLSAYTYTAIRVAPLALACFGLYAFAVHRSKPRDGLSGTHTRTAATLRGISLAAAAALVALLPLAAYTIGNPEIVLGRPDQVSILNPLINQGDPWKTLLSSVVRTLGMFFIRGDRIWRHNVPWRPVFDPVLGALSVVGAIVAAARSRRDLAAGFTLLWVTVMLLPTLLAEDAPHFLRAVGVLPTVALLPALGLDWLARHAPSKHRTGHTVYTLAHPLIVTVPFAVSLVCTTGAYFGDYADNDTTGFWFEEGAVALAGRINGFVGAGWNGERMLHERAEHARVVVDSSLWDQWPQLHFLVTSHDNLVVGLEPTEAYGARGMPVHTADSPAVAVFAWPYGDWEKAWALLPAPAEITVEEGPPSQGDLDPASFTTYVGFFATSPSHQDTPLGRFAQGVELLGATVEPRLGLDPSRPAQAVCNGLDVRLRWRATAPLESDYTVFVHYLRDGKRLAQVDSRPANGYYPTTTWRPGDVVNDSHCFTELSSPQPERDALHLGLWKPETQEVLYLLDSAGNPAGDWIELTLDEGVSD